MVVFVVKLDLIAPHLVHPTWPGPWFAPKKAEMKVPTLLIFDDVDRWLSSPKRREFLGPLGFTVRTFVDPAKTNRVGLIVEGGDLATFQKAIQSDDAADSMRFDGVGPDTIVLLEEA